MSSTEFERDVLEQLDRILNSSGFRNAFRMAACLRHLVAETLAGRVKSFEARTDDLARLCGASSDANAEKQIKPVNMDELRRRLENYYVTEGWRDSIRLSLPAASLLIGIERREEISGPPAGSPMPLNGPKLMVGSFSCLSDKPADKYFCEGLVTEARSALARDTNFRLVAPESAFPPAEPAEDLEEIRVSMGVDLVLTGSIRWSEERVRVQAQITEADGGVVIWMDNFDCHLSRQNSLDVQSWVAKRLAEAAGRVEWQSPKRRSTGHKPALSS